MTQPAPQLTYPELACLEDMDAFASETTSDLQGLEQDVYHLLIETPGSNPDDPDRGVGIEQLLSGSTDQLNGLSQTIDAELLKDDRVDSSKTTLIKLPPGSSLPNGVPLPQGGYLLEVQIVAGANVLGLSFSYSSAQGLSPL